MLTRLAINQFVIIDKLALDFKPGLTVLTGETGAGKSILLDAMGLILGEEPDPESIRQKSDESVIEAMFAPTATHPVWAFLTGKEVPASPESGISVHRTIGRTGKDDILINGKSVEREILKETGAYLVEIHGQNANQNLLAPARQLALLDAFGSYPPDILGNVRTNWNDLLRYTKELEEEQTFIARNAHEQPRIEKLVNEFNKLGIRKGFYEETLAEYRRLATCRETMETFQSIQAQLVASNGAEQALARANHTVGRQKERDGDMLLPLSEFLSGALDNTRKAIDEMTRLTPQYDIDTSAIHKLEEVLKGLQRLAKECGVKIEELFDHYEQVSAQLERIKNARGLITKLDDLLTKTKVAYRENAHILTEARIKAGKALSAAITAEMPPLKLLRAQFEVEVAEKPDNPWSDLGFNEVVFTARTNPGMPFSPIAKTASGGELVRMILALKVVLQRVQTISSLVFDEVDTGIGGAVAAAVGERIARLAALTQVLVITHSPQVAARGDQHLHVSKKTDGVTTETVVRVLSTEERINEISRMLAGDTITSEAQAAARSLIEEAHQAAEARRNAAATQKVDA